MSYNHYADDTQIYIKISPGNDSFIHAPYMCIIQIHDWMCHNFLQLKKIKDEKKVLEPKKEEE